ncbi:MAG: hypothetical protein JNK90_07900 [Planctomycetaceae bacterium]|nr:hypothetical protein [Planctomycetaceae bacterium]
MSREISWIEQLRIGIIAIIWFVLVSLFLVSLPILLAGTWWFVLGIFAVSCFIALPIFALRRVWHRDRPGYSGFSLYSRTALGVTMASAFLIALPIYGCAILVNVKPLTVPRIVLTNGDRTIVLQGMIHIGSEVFYKSVAYDVERAIADGYHIRYEGVKPSPGEGDEFLSAYMGTGGEMNDHYKQLADLCGLTFQVDYFGLLEQHSKTNPEQVIETDVDALQLKKEYERLLANDPEFAASEDMTLHPKTATKNATESMSYMMKWLHGISPEQQKIVGILTRGFLNYHFSHRERGSQQEKLILQFRNRYVAGQLLADKSDKIYVLYGAAHLPGIVDLIRKDDPNWKVSSTSWQRTMISSSEEAELEEGTR